MPGGVRFTCCFRRPRGSRLRGGQGCPGCVLRIAPVSLLRSLQVGGGRHPSAGSGAGGRVVLGRISPPLVGLQGSLTPATTFGHLLWSATRKHEYNIHCKETSKKQTYPRARLQPSDTGISADPAEEPWDSRAACWQQWRAPGPAAGSGATPRVAAPAQRHRHRPPCPRGRPLHQPRTREAPVDSPPGSRPRHIPQQDMGNGPLSPPPLLRRHPPRR